MAAGLMRSRRTLLAGAVGLSGAAALALLADQLSPLLVGAVLRNVEIAARLAVLCAALAGWGDLIGRALLGGAPPPWTTRCALGAAGTATLMGWLAPWWFPDARLLVPWLGAGIALLARALRRDGWPGMHLPGPRPLWLVTGICLLPAALLASMPPTSLDSLVYHLAIPRQALIAGRLGDFPTMQHSYFPLHAEMLFAAALEIDPGGCVAQGLHLAAALAALVVVARIAERLFGAGAGAWAAMLLASIPALALVAGVAWNDWFVLLYLACAIEHHLRATADDAPRERVLEALLLGAAVATKYVALPALLLPLLPRPGGWRRTVAAMGVVAAIALPWYGRNLALRGNPVFPLLDDGPAASALAWYRGEGIPLVERLQGYVFRADLADEGLGLLLPAALLVAAVALAGRRLVPSWLLLLGAVYLPLPLISHPTIRAFGPLLLVLALVGAGGMASIATSERRRIAIAVTTAPLLLYGVMQTAVFFESTQELTVPLGLEDEARFLRRREPSYAAFEWIHSHAPPAAGVLVVGESRVFHLRRPATWASYLDPHPIAAFAPPGAPVQRVADDLAARGIRLVYFHPAQYRVGPRPAGRHRELVFHVDERDDRAFRNLLEQRARPVYHRDGSWVFALLP
jgi:hypothetical protein